MTREPSFAALLEKFFIQRLMHQRQASVHTIASYRDTFRLLLEFVQRRLHKAPSTLALEDIWIASTTMAARVASRRNVTRPIVVVLPFSFLLWFAGREAPGLFGFQFSPP